MNAKSILAIIAAWEEDNLAHQPEDRRVHRPAVERLIAELRTALKPPIVLSNEMVTANLYGDACDDEGEDDEPVVLNSKTDFDSLWFIMAVEEGEIKDEAELREGLTQLRNRGILSSLQGFWQRLANELGV